MKKNCYLLCLGKYKLFEFNTRNSKFLLDFTDTFIELLQILFCKTLCYDKFYYVNNVNAK